MGRDPEPAQAVREITTHRIAQRQCQHGGSYHNGPNQNGTPEDRRQDTRNAQFHHHDRGPGNGCQRQARVFQRLPGALSLASGF